jgi:hypothetical protein
MATTDGGQFNMPIDYRGLPVNPHELYQRYSNGLPEGFSFRDLMAANPTQYDPSSYNDTEERIRQWIAAGRPGWDSQGRMLGVHGQLLDDFSASVNNSAALPNRLNGAPVTTYNGAQGNPAGRSMNQTTYGFNRTQSPPLSGPGTPNPASGNPLGYTPTGIIGGPPTGAAPQRDIYTNPAAVGSPTYGSPRNQQQTPATGNPAAGTIPTLYNQAQGNTYQQVPQPNLNLLARQGMGNRQGMRSPLASRPQGSFAARSPGRYQGY